MNFPDFNSYSKLVEIFEDYFNSEGLNYHTVYDREWNYDNDENA